MQIATPPVVTAQHGTNDSPILFRNETEARVASQIRGDGAARVGLVQPHTFSASPQCDDRVVVFDTERADDYSIVSRCDHSITIFRQIRKPAEIFMRIVW
jgi:hypothetical protein